MKALLKNPLSLWLKWYIQSRKVLKQNKNKNLQIGYMTWLVNVQLGNYNTFYDHVTVGNSTLADYIYISSGTKIGNATIGKFCSIGPNVKIGLGMHPTHFISTFPAFFSVRKQCQVTFVEKNYFNEVGRINIGNDVWIGANATIMDNVTIGDGAIIAAGAMVTKDVEPYTIVGGIPARILKTRFNKDEIKKLLAFKWWDKDIDWIKENSSFFNNTIEFFEKTKINEIHQ